MADLPRGAGRQHLVAAPRGASGNGPSTYWIDQAAQGARTAYERGDEDPFTCGNITLLRVRGDAVVASFDFAEDDEPGQAMPLADFLALLHEWRRKVEESAACATEPLRETYRRNPAR